MRPRTVITLLICVLFSALLGCLPTYVGDPEKSTMDPKFLGIWHLPADHRDQLWFVHKLDARGYLLQRYGFKRADDMTASLDDSPTTAHAWLATIGGATFVSMEVLDPKQIASPDSAERKNRYIVARVELKDDKLTVRGISPESIKDKDITTPQKFEQLIKDHLDDKELYLETQTFSRIDPTHTQPIQDLLDVIK